MTAKVIWVVANVAFWMICCAIACALVDAWLYIFQRLRIEVRQRHALTRRVAALERAANSSSKPGLPQV